jgi:dTDP-glucose pyrophosphorylase
MTMEQQTPTININNFIVSPDTPIRDAICKMDKAGQKILFVYGHENTLVGALSDGDIRRHLLKHGTIAGIVENCFNSNPVRAYETDDESKIKSMMLSNKIEVIPIVDRKNSIIDIAVWNSFFSARNKRHPDLSLSVVVMAGGKGTRLDPFTKILPKPLIPIGDKPILEIIMDRFAEYGVSTFYLTVNYKGEMIKSYFDNIDCEYNINYIWEKEFLGTGGSLRLLPSEVGDTFIVSNCDILVELDYTELIHFHKQHQNDITIVGALLHHVVPYGVLDYSEKGILNSLIEKPQYDFTINTGIYVVQKDALVLIPENKFFHITELIEALMQRKRKVAVYPVREASYIDVGQWEEYKKNADKFKFL